MLKELSVYRTDPLGMVRTVFDKLRTITDGEIEVVDPNNPFTYLIDSACFTSAVHVQESVAHLRKLYQDLAQTREDLYRHLSDMDMFDLFSQPSNKVFHLFLSLDEILEKAVLDNSTGVKKLVIPRHTQVNIVDYFYTLQYPIEIRVLNHGGIQIVYDNEQPVPTQLLESNQLTYRILTIKGYNGKFVQIDLPLQQLKLSSKRFVINSSSGVVKELPYNDQYSMTRAWLSTDTGWREVPVIHQDTVYDRANLAVFAVVKEDTVYYTIPAPLLNDTIVGRTLRIDTYTSKGEINHNIDNYQSDQFVLVWNNYDDSDLSFTAPLETFQFIQLTATGTLEGGRNALSFNEIKQLTNNNALGAIRTPITHHQLEVLCDRRGYRISLFVDNLTDRIMYASKELPKLSNSSLSSGASMTSQPVKFNMSSLKGRPDVYHHGDAVLITPDVLFEQNGGAIRPLSFNEITQLKGSGEHGIASQINNREILYSPFYYQLDHKNDRFDASVFDLDNPVILSKLFVQENVSTMMQIQTVDYYIVKSKNGYKLHVVAKGLGSAVDIPPSTIIAQLRTTPIGETQAAYMNGRYLKEVENGWLFEFDINIAHYIDRNDALGLTNFTMFDTASRVLPVNLELDFSLVYYVERYYVPSANRTSLDDVYASWLASGTYVGVVEDRFHIRLGERLKWLWVGGRAVPGPLTFQRHRTNKVKLHPEDVYETNEDGSKKLIEGPDGRFNFNLIHAKGTPVMVNGQPDYEYRVNDLVMVNGEPVVSNDRELEFMINVLLVEGSFYFATARESRLYRDSIAQTLTQWTIDDLNFFNTRTLTGTEIYFYPQNTAGMIDVFVENNRRVSIKAAQSPKVRFYVTRLGYENTQLRIDLENYAREVIAKHLRNRVITKTGILNELSSVLSGDVLDIEVTQLGGESDLNTITLTDPQNSCTLRKRLEVLTNRELVVRDDLDVEFILHTMV